MSAVVMGIIGGSGIEEATIGGMSWSRDVVMFKGSI